MGSSRDGCQSKPCDGKLVVVVVKVFVPKHAKVGLAGFGLFAHQFLESVCLEIGHGLGGQSFTVGCGDSHKGWLSVIALERQPNGSLSVLNVSTDEGLVCFGDAFLPKETVEFHHGLPGPSKDHHTRRVHVQSMHHHAIQRFNSSIVVVVGNVFLVHYRCQGGVLVDSWYTQDTRWFVDDNEMVVLKQDLEVLFLGDGSTGSIGGTSFA